MPRVTLACSSMIASFAMRRLPSYRRRRARFIGTGWTDWRGAGLNRGRAGVISALLRRVVDQAFCSSWGDDALNSWGTWRFRRGDSVNRWQCTGGSCRTVPVSRIVADPSRSLRGPGAGRRQEGALSRGRGREAAGQGRARRVRKALSRGDGALAGRKGPYAEILAESLAADHLAPPAQVDSRWPTFAGSLSRSKVVAGPIDVGSTQWRVELDKVGMTRQNSFMPRGGGLGAAPAPRRAVAGLPPDRAG